MKHTELNRTVTELDHVRLKSLVQHDLRGLTASAAAQALDDILDDASTLPSSQIPPDVVTMYTQVLLRDVATEEQRQLTLCYPKDAEPDAGFVSVLSPVGWSLLGLRVGEVARWSTPDGESKQAEILAILFQPEASGDLTM